MSWDSSRPVPWQRLIREWLLYIAVFGVVALILFRSKIDAGNVGGLLASGPMYLIFGGVLAKLGYQRKTYGELRNSRRQRSVSTSPSTSPSTSAGRQRPAPTKRTAGHRSPAAKRSAKKR